MKQYSINGLDVAFGLKNVNNQEDFYDMVLETYCQEALEKIEIYRKVGKNFLQENLQKTIVDMHGIKGANKGIGALELGEKFRQMEFAGKEGNVAFLYENMESYINEYKEMVEQIQAVLAANKEDDFIQSDRTESTFDYAVIDDMVQALDDIDFDRFEEIMDELREQNFGPNINRSLKEAWNYYDNFDYEEAADILKQLKG